jgi:hypothetical protein
LFLKFNRRLVIALAKSGQASYRKAACLSAARGLAVALDLRYITFALNEDNSI